MYLEKKNSALYVHDLVKSAKGLQTDYSFEAQGHSFYPESYEVGACGTLRVAGGDQIDRYFGVLGKARYQGEQRGIRQQGEC